MRLRALGGSLLVLAAVSVTGCSDEDESPPSGPGETSTTQEMQYDLCGATVSHTEMMRFLDGNLVVVASHVEQGVGAGQIVGGLVAGLVLNGIDFSNLDYEPAFSDGRYELTNGDAYVGVTLYFAEDFGPHAAGDVIPYNVFDVSSYVKDFEITSFDPFSGDVGFDFEEGPLYGLIEGDVDFDIDNPTSISIRVRIRTDLVAFEAKSEKTYFGMPPRMDDELRVVMTTTHARLDEVYAQFLGEGYGFSYTGTTYDSPFFGIEQELTDSLFLMKRDEGGGWFWEGDYESDVTKSPLTMYQSGFVSNLEGNYTEYYCDAALTTRAGVAQHHLDLSGGEFVFEDGTRLPYGLMPF